MRSALVVEAEELVQLRGGVDHRPVALQINLLGFHRPPESLDEDIVEAPAFAVHRQLHPAGQQGGRELGRRELTALVGVGDFRRAVPRDGPMGGAHAEACVERVGQFSREHGAAVPVEARAEIPMPALHRARR